jgi:hypothetical protein
LGHDTTKYGVRLKGLGAMILIIMVWIIFHLFVQQHMSHYTWPMSYIKVTFFNMKEKIILWVNSFPCLMWTIELIGMWDLQVDMCKIKDSCTTIWRFQSGVERC